MQPTITRHIKLATTDTELAAAVESAIKETCARMCSHLPYTHKEGCDNAFHVRRVAQYARIITLLVSLYGAKS